MADIGVASDLPQDLGVLHRKFAWERPTGHRGRRWTREEATRAIQIGMDIFDASDADLAIVGEMGIGNTTTAAALSAALTRLPASGLIGRGTGVDDDGFARKLAAVEAGLARLPHTSDPLEILTEIGGWRSRRWRGVALAAARRRVPVLLDGFISTTAGVLAARDRAGGAPVSVVLAPISGAGAHASSHLLRIDAAAGSGHAPGRRQRRGARHAARPRGGAILRDVSTFEQAGVSDREAP